jgi:hypothetical protein
MILQERKSSMELKTFADDLPRPACTVLDKDDADLSLSWLLLLLPMAASGPAAADDSALSSAPVLECYFGIDRQAKACRTPRRNGDVSAALDQLDELQRWASRVQNFVKVHLLELVDDKRLDLVALEGQDLFQPAVPLLHPCPTTRGSIAQGVRSR